MIWPAEQQLKVTFGSREKSTPVSKIKQNNGRIILACEEWQAHYNNFNKKVADTRKGTLPLR